MDESSSPNIPKMTSEAHIPPGPEILSDVAPSSKVPPLSREIPSPQEISPSKGIETPPVGPLAMGQGSVRLRKLLWLFSILLLLLLTPSLTYQVQYAITAAKEQAEVDTACKNLPQLQFAQLSLAFRLLPKAVGPSVVNIRTQQPYGLGQGSGVIVDTAGYIVTNHHVVEGVRTVQVHLSDGRHGPATLIGTDPLTDVAVLKTEMRNLVAAQWGDSDQLDVGDMVWAIGSPFGLQKSTTFGILSAKERRGISAPGRHARRSIYQEFLQTDAAVNPGNSGGPLVNIKGKIIGINTAIVGPAYQGISFAIPSTLARKTYELILRDGEVKRGFLGVIPEKVSDKTARDLELERNIGVFVRSIEKNAPSEDAGLEPGDVILTWDNVPYSDPTLLSRAIAASAIGSKVKMEIVRSSPKGPKQMQLTVTIAARPPIESL